MANFDPEANYTREQLVAFAKEKGLKLTHRRKPKTAKQLLADLKRAKTQPPWGFTWEAAESPAPTPILFDKLPTSLNI